MLYSVIYLKRHIFKAHKKVKTLQTVESIHLSSI